MGDPREGYRHIPEITFMTGMDYKNILMAVPADTKVTICTYSFFGAFNYYYKPALQHLKHVDLIVNRPGLYKEMFEHNLPNVHLIDPSNNENAARTHAKMLFIEPDILYLSSQNFGETDWFQHAIRIKDKVTYDYYMGDLQVFLEKGYTGNIKMNTTGEWDRPGRGRTGNIVPDLTGQTCENVYSKMLWSRNYNAKLNNVKDRCITIVTYTMPDLSYVRLILDKLINSARNQVFVVGNSKIESKLKQLKREFSDFDYVVYDNVHAKMILYNGFDLEKGDGTVILSSENFGTSGWFENMIIIKEKGYKYYMDKLDEFMKSAEV